MSFSSLVSDLTFRDTDGDERRRDPHLSRTVSYARSYTSTAATSVSISGDISSQLHGGYSHPLARSWQAERQLTKVFQSRCCSNPPLTLLVDAHLPSLHLGSAGGGNLNPFPPQPAPPRHQQSHPSPGAARPQRPSLRHSFWRTHGLGRQRRPRDRCG